MATFPRPRCELRALLTKRASKSSPPGRGRLRLVQLPLEDIHFPSMTAVVRVRRKIFAGLLEEARRNPRIECCGLLAGTEGVIAEICPAKNALASATAYAIAPEELFGLFRRMRQRGLDHLGIYHSHPTTENVPSPTDIERAFYPGVAYFILSPGPRVPRPIRAFWILDGAVTELAIEEVKRSSPARFR